MSSIERHYSRKLISLDASKSCQEAAGLMHEHHVGSVAVTRGGRTIGLISERDLVTNIVRLGISAKTPLGDIVPREAPSVPPGASERECADLMRAHRTRHLLVAENDAVAGVVSMRDVIALMLDDKEHIIGALEGYIRRA